MAITITIDNDRLTGGIQPLLADETAGVQPTDTPTDDGNEIDITLVGGVLGGFQPAFNNFLNALPLTSAQKNFARDHDGASSASDLPTPRRWATTTSRCAATTLRRTPSSPCRT